MDLNQFVYSYSFAGHHLVNQQHVNIQNSGSELLIPNSQQLQERHHQIITNQQSDMVVNNVRLDSNPKKRMLQQQQQPQHHQQEMVNYWLKNKLVEISSIIINKI